MTLCPAIQGENNWVVLLLAVGTVTHLALDMSGSPVQEPLRVHLDLFAENPVYRAFEVEWLVSFGG